MAIVMLYVQKMLLLNLLLSDSLLRFSLRTLFTPFTNPNGYSSPDDSRRRSGCLFRWWGGGDGGGGGGGSGGMG